MNKGTKFCAMALCAALMSGCATGLTNQATTNSRSDVFRVANGGTVQEGDSELNISGSLKTHRNFEYPLNFPHSHGTADYRLILNIDGQSHVVSAQLKEETLVNYAPGDPEEGFGIRYLFRERFHLPAGRHRIILSLPDDGIAVSREIDLDAGSVNSLVIGPDYNVNGSARKTMVKRNSDFRAGIKGLRLTLNGAQL